jgi:5-methylcytosine-specific restriction protein A
MSKRNEFSKRTKLEAWQRAKGRCEECGVKLSTTNVEFHHAKPCTFDDDGGDNSVSNVVVLCRLHHRLITDEQVPIIAKSNRQRAKHLGITNSRGRPLPGGRNSRWKKKLDGRVVPR